MRVSGFSVSLLTLCLAVPAGAQSGTAYPSPFTTAPTSDADALANQMRLLAANPMNLNALVRAGELALKLDDPTAAAALFTRAERIDPRNARVKAGEASLLVDSERPGEALRRFAEAETLGGDVRAFAADRGLAYDLIGEQERAQRSYRLALKSGANDETVRRYALSLGISGKRDMALQQLDPLLRRSDRGAWRARAFILAMGGDRPAAEKIATSMMPAGMAQGLQPFFERLPTLSAVDRAFAVHFGEVRPTPERLIDARYTPPLPPLGLDPDAPVQVAAVLKVPTKVDARAERRKEKERRRDERRIQLASRTPAPRVALPAAAVSNAKQQVALAANTTRLPAAIRAAPARTSAAQQPAATMTPAVTPASTSVVVLAGASDPIPRAVAATVPKTMPPLTPRGSIRSGSSAIGAAVETDTRVSAVSAIAPTVADQAARMPPVLVSPVVASPVVANPVVAGASLPSATVIGMPSTGAATPGVSATPVASAIPPAGQPVPTFVQPVVGTSAAPVVGNAPRGGPKPVRSEDSILAAIIANINVPGAELDVAPVEPPRIVAVAAAPLPKPAEPAPIAAAKSDDAAVSVVRPASIDKKAATSKKVSRDEAALADNVDPSIETRKITAKKTPDNKVVADKKALTDKKTLTDKKAGADKKAAADKKAVADKKVLADKKLAEARKKDPKILEPSRIWVQVAGGANEGDLPKQWAKLRDKEPTAFKGRQGWTTPLRATNRIVTGPFKTSAEAQAFVNGLTKKGLSGFVFTSDAGQKLARLPAK